MKRILLLVAFVLAVPLSARAQYDRPGSTDGQFLNIGVDARASAMGGAYISLATGAEATYYNPAGLSYVKETSIVFDHTTWFAGINHEFAAVAHNFGEAIGTFAISATALYTDQMEVTTPLQPDGTGETFQAANYRIGLSYARVLTDHVSFGGTVNYINMSLFRGFDASAYSLDIATMYVTDFRGFRFGMMISNFGSDVKFVNEAYPLPLNFTFGAAVNAIDGKQLKLTLSGSAVKPNDGKPLAQVGAELVYDDAVALRAGYDPGNDTETYSFGVGARANILGYQTEFDYAYSNYGLLGGINRFELVLAF